MPNNNSRLDTIIEMMRNIAPEGHRIHTADIADLRIAVSALIERQQLADENN